MDAELAKKLAQQQADTARAALSNGTLTKFMAGYHCGVISALHHSVLTADDCAFINKLTEEMARMAAEVPA